MYDCKHQLRSFKLMCVGHKRLEECCICSVLLLDNRVTQERNFWSYGERSRGYKIIPVGHYTGPGGLEYKRGLDV